ncbi:FxsA family protein [Thermoactinomyces sp. DSM 45892]|uniref:FxsA family protein n=1 Tax=Thermoactinomyces sp. DSM 45892 TaxID=1882753 RepID=UPI00089BAFD0|nr:FxsA family protein [Thermoactinomyces sp. DSM 45892]SDZ12931.1 UPF0716 protein FxsA [Thermoactinomyces sp. DSM 45892]
MIKRLFLPFILLGILEIWGIAFVGNWIGPIPTVLLILASAFLGWHYARRQGLQILRVIRLRLSNQEVPGDEVIDGLLILVGGILLIIPGFLSDIIGILMMIPYTRGMMRLLVKYTFKTRIAKRMVVWGPKRR